MQVFFTEKHVSYGASGTDKDRQTILFNI